MWSFTSSLFPFPAADNKEFYSFDLETQFLRPNKAHSRARYFVCLFICCPSHRNVHLGDISI